MWEPVTITSDKQLYGLAELAASHYGEKNDTASTAFLKHEYFENPCGTAIVKAAYNSHKDEYAGQAAAIPIRIRINSRQYRCLLAANVLTRADYRGEGIFKRLSTEMFTAAESEDYSLLYAMPNPYSRPCFLKYHRCSDLGSVPLYLRPLTPSGMVKSYLHSRLLSRFAGLFDASFHIKNSYNCQLADFRSVMDLYADRLWQSIQDNYPVMLVRDSSFIRWRYADNPCRNYLGYYALSDEGSPVAFAVGRNMEVSGFSCAMVADFVFMRGHEAEAIAALVQLLEDLEKQGGEMAGCMVPHASYERKLITSMGFFRCPHMLEPQPFRFVYRKLNDTSVEAETAGDLKNWFFTMGDYDVV